ncbi:MAG TPA: endonuclease VIII [Rhodanobacteraceae bacterium]
MPEGPEIRRAADALAAAVVGTPLASVWFHDPALKKYERVLRGRRIESIEPRGKALLTRFDNGLTLYSHNQLYGVWRVANAGERPRTQRSLRVALETADKAILLYSATDISIWRTDAIDAHPFLARIGPDVLDPTFDVDAAKARLADPRFARRNLGALLLDQAFLAGLGNYLRVEILWQAALAPELKPIDLDAHQRAELAAAIVDVPMRSYRWRTKSRAKALQKTSFRFRAYHRAGKPCERCGSAIVRTTVASRPFYFCPLCQNTPGRARKRGARSART